MEDNLKAATVERLQLLQEECAEVIQAVSKILRFGPDSRHPDFPEGLSNEGELYAELGGLCAILDLMDDAGEVDLDQVDRAQAHKKKTIHYFTKFQGDQNGI